MVAAMVSGASVTNCTASLVVMCSNTTRSSGRSRSSGCSTRSMNTASRSNTSTAGSVTSPCTSSGMPQRCISSSAGYALRDVGDARIGIGGRSCRIQFDRMHDAACSGTLNLLRRGVVGEIQRHQRLERGACRQRGEDARAIGARLLGGSDRWPQVGHDDGAGKLPRGIGQHGLHQQSIAQMQVPVVGSGNSKFLQDEFRPC